MKTPVEKRKPSGIVDYIALALTTVGVGYGPIAPGTWGSAVGVAIYVAIEKSLGAIGEHYMMYSPQLVPFIPEAYTHLFPTKWVVTIHAVIAVALLLFCLIGIWASNRSIPLLGNEDPPEAVVDEVMGQLITFLFIPFGVGWPFIFAGFLLFRLFDIWKPYPVRNLEVLSGGLGICADDIVAGVYAGVCLSVIYAVSSFL